MTVLCQHKKLNGENDRLGSVERVDRTGSVVAKVARESMVMLALLRRLVDEVAEGERSDVEADLVEGPDQPSAESPSGTTARVGARLGPYRIHEFLSAGGMGEVYGAVDERLDRAVALKVLPGHLCADRHRQRRLREEGKLLSAISHPHICTLYDVGHSGGVDFLVMEYLKGRSLADRLAAGPLTLSEALRIGSQIASALEAAHRAGIVHRDLKPGNVMLTGRPESLDPGVKILDFGLARVMGGAEVDRAEDSFEDKTKTDANNVEGTCPYMAPEQFVSKDVDARTDIWALGVILYEMVCGRRPFQGNTAAALVMGILSAAPKAPSQVGGGCSRDLSRVIERCLEKDRSKRWPSCAELARRLDDAILDGDRDDDEEDTREVPRVFLERFGAAAVLGAFLMAAAPAPSPAQSVSVDRLDRPQMEEMLLQGRVTKLRPLSVGVSRSSRAVVTWQATSHDAHIQTIDTFLGGGARFTNLSDSYRYNVAAYRLDRMLGLEMVPVSVVRTIDGKPAAVTWWVDDVEMMELERRKLDRRPSDVRGWNEQMDRASIFQELISNSDCNQTNLLITKDWRIWLVDFTRAFRVYPKLIKPNAMMRLDPRLRDALEQLDEAGLRPVMKGLLSRAQIRGILLRRDLILAHFDEGSSAVVAVDAAVATS